MHTLIAVVDIDGTIADIGHRIHFINGVNGEKKEWTRFFNAMNEDSPIRPICALVGALASKYKIVYLTGRPSSHRGDTVSWLTNHCLPTGTLIMRKVGDHRPDYMVKKELYETQVIPFVGRASLVIEDRDQVVEMWRGLGLTCLQPRRGDY